jgi:hypothetical protein
LKKDNIVEGKRTTKGGPVLVPAKFLIEPLLTRIAGPAADFVQDFKSGRKHICVYGMK